MCVWLKVDGAVVCSCENVDGRCVVLSLCILAHAVLLESKEEKRLVRCALAVPLTDSHYAGAATKGMKLKAAIWAKDKGAIHAENCQLGGSVTSSPADLPP